MLVGEKVKEKDWMRENWQLVFMLFAWSWLKPSVLLVLSSLLVAPYSILATPPQGAGVGWYVPFSPGGPQWLVPLLLPGGSAPSPHLLRLQG